MKKLLVLLLCLSGAMLFAQTDDLHYVIDETGDILGVHYTVTCVLTIDGVEEYNGAGMHDAGGGDLEIGAFDQDGNCRGAKLPTWNNTYSRWIYQLKLRGNTGFTYPVFKVYDHATETEMDLILDIEDVITYSPSGTLGKVKNPYLLNFTHEAVLSWTRDIAGYGESNGGYVLIASPVDNVAPADANLIDENELYYDLFRFNQSADGGEWENYKVHNFNLEVGKGYLYARKTDVVMEVSGTPYDGEGYIDLVYDEGSVFKGFNLIGNPYTTAAGIDMPYYKLDDETGSYFDATLEDVDVELMTGVLVQATATVTQAKFTPADSGKRGNEIPAVNIVASKDGNAFDKVIIRFDGGATLGKFQEEGTRIYIPQNDDEYAIANAESSVMPLNFNSEDFGTYTISVDLNGTDIPFMHLLDDLTGANIDLLVEPSYTFTASANDTEDRFRLVFDATSLDEIYANGIFTYQNGDELIVTGDGTLQVYDLMGRLVCSQEINGSKRLSASLFDTNVYIFKLVGESIRTQKVVVR